MSDITFLLFVKTFTEMAHADAFMSGTLFMNTLRYFRNLEEISGDGRGDRHEAISNWWQPHDIGLIRLGNPQLGHVDMTARDFGGPFSTSYERFGDLHLFCMYAVWVKTELLSKPSAVDAAFDRLTTEAHIGRFGDYVVVCHPGSFLSRVREKLPALGYQWKGRLIDYYDPRTFSGNIPDAQVPFSKQDRFSYQREFRICVQPKIISNRPITPNVGDLRGVAFKATPATLKLMRLAVHN